MVVAAMGGSFMAFTSVGDFVFGYTCTFGERQAARVGVMEVLGLNAELVQWQRTLAIRHICRWRRRPWPGGQGS
jgi:hypothetical protein